MLTRHHSHRTRSNFINQMRGSICHLAFELKTCSHGQADGLLCLRTAFSLCSTFFSQHTFWIHMTIMSNVWIYVVCYESCSPGRPSCVAKTLMLDITRKLFNQMFAYLPSWGGPNFYGWHYAQTFQPVFDTHGMLMGTTVSDFIILDISVTLTLSSSQGQCKVVPVCFMFSHTFWLMRTNFRYGVGTI